MLALLGLMITEKHDQGWLIHQQQVGPDPESCPFGTMLPASLELHPTSLTDMHSLQIVFLAMTGVTLITFVAMPPLVAEKEWKITFYAYDILQQENRY